MVRGGPFLSPQEGEDEQSIAARDVEIAILNRQT
jgi:hypothetical protein